LPARPLAAPGRGDGGARRAGAPPRRSPRMKVAPLALALLLLLPFAPLARADAPQAEPWTPYNALAQTHALAFARQGTTIAVALDAYSFVSTGCTLVCPPTNPTQPPTTVPDLSILQSD